MGQEVRRLVGDQRGLTMIEALLSVIIVSVAVVTIAGGLLLSSRVDNDTNERQRANLALTTFSENLTYTARPDGVACGIGAGAPVSSSGATNPSSHAALLMERATGATEVAEWIDRGMMYRITAVAYGSSTSGAGEEAFSASCSTAAADPDAPVYPVIRVEVEACRTRSAVATSCPAGAVVVASDVVRRGGRSGA